MSNNTYGSYGLREERLNYTLGIKIKFDNLFINLYNYWVLSHHLHQQILWRILDFDCSNVTTLENNIRKKWSKDLPHVNIVLEKFEDADEFFNMIQFLEKFDNENYFGLLEKTTLDFLTSWLEEKKWKRLSLVKSSTNETWKSFMQVTKRDNKGISFFF